MKKLVLFVLCLAMCLSLAAPAFAEGEAVDAFTSASVADFYGAAAITGDDLMNALNSFSGFYTIATVNPDGTPNEGYFIYGCVKNGEKYYLQLGLAENQTRQNLVATGKCVAVYAAAPDMSVEGAKPYAVSGARMFAEMVTDEALIKELNVTGSDTTLFFEIMETRSLG